MIRITSLALVIGLATSLPITTASAQESKRATDAPPARVQERAQAEKAGAKKAGAKKAGAQKAGAQKAGAQKAGAQKAGAQKKKAEGPTLQKKKAADPVKAEAGAKKKAEGGPQLEGKPAGTPAKKAAGGAGPVAKPEHREMVKKLALEERKHRERKARIARLRVLAEQKGQKERVAAIDALLEKENARYARWVDEGRKALGKEKFEDVDAKLRKGRAHGVGAKKSGPKLEGKKVEGDPVKKEAGKEHAGEVHDRAEGKAREHEDEGHDGGRD